MNGMEAKLHNQRGASILMALVFFLVCGFVGAVILGSAVTNAQKTQGRQADQQVYASVSSAARLIRDTLEDMSCQGQEHWTDRTCNDASSPVSSASAEPDEKAMDHFQGADNFDGKLAELVRQGAEQVYRSQTVYAEPTAFTGWSKSFTVEDGAVAVEAEVSIDADYRLTFLLRPAEEGAGSHEMTLVCPATTEQTDRESRGSCSHSYWVEDLYSYEGGHWETTDFPYTVRTRETTVTWSRGTVSKGV